MLFSVKQLSNLETINDFLRYGLTCANQASLYYGHGTDNAWDDILTLVLGSLTLPLDINPEILHARLTKDEKEKILLLLQKRIVGRVPVPYLLNNAHFCGLDFYVDSRVLIPRSPIAELIEQQFKPWVENVENVLDLCTGSGCIAIACAYAFLEAHVDAVDISKDALDVAKINVERHHMQRQVNLIESDCFKAMPSKKYDIIVSNPPYVGLTEMQTLPCEYKHEPSLALEAQANGLAIVDEILMRAPDYLTEHGVLVVEVGNSEEELIAKYPQLPFTWLDFERGGSGVFLLTAEQLSIG